MSFHLHPLPLQSLLHACQPHPHSQTPCAHYNTPPSTPLRPITPPCSHPSLLPPSRYTGDVSQYAPCLGDSWEGNAAVGGGCGPSVASTPVTYALTLANPRDVTAYTSAEPLAVHIALHDVFGQLHDPAVVDSEEGGATVVTVNDALAFGQRQARVGDAGGDAFSPVLLCFECEFLLDQVEVWCVCVSNDVLWVGLP